MTGYFESLINDVPGNADNLATLAIQWDAYGISCNDYADDVAHSARAAREWEGAARSAFNASLTHQRNRYLNLGGDSTTASSAIKVYEGAVRSGQSYIENLRYQASKLDEEVRQGSYSPAGQSDIHTRSERSCFRGAHSNRVRQAGSRHVRAGPRAHRTHRARPGKRQQQHHGRRADGAAVAE